LKGVGLSACPASIKSLFLTKKKENGCGRGFWIRDGDFQSLGGKEISRIPSSFHTRRCRPDIFGGILAQGSLFRLLNEVEEIFLSRKSTTKKGKHGSSVPTFLEL